jgi:hypothetical protein
MLMLISFFVILYVKTHGSNSPSFVTATFAMAMDKNLIAVIVVAQQLFANRSPGKRGSGSLLPTNTMFQLNILRQQLSSFLIKCWTISYKTQTGPT